MEPSQAKNEINTPSNGHEERISRIDSDIKRQKQQLLKELEGSSDEDRKRRPKNSQSETDRLKILQIETPASEQKPFAPFVADTLQLKGDKGIYFDAASYNEKYNMIIACPQDSSVQFYNATTLLPMERFETEKLDSWAIRMPYCSQSETYLLGCSDGNIYAYNLSSRILHKIQEQGPTGIVAMTFLNSKYYAFAAVGSHHFSLGNLENGDLMNINLEKQRSCYLSRLEKGSFLLSSQVGGPLHVHRTDQLPRLPIICSARGYDSSESFSLAKIQSLLFKGKEYMLTIGWKGRIKIWHFSKGKMKPLKTFHTGDRIGCAVYLENYQMLAISHTTQFIQFFRFPSGILESTLDLNMQKCRSIFLMKDKNCLGASSVDENKIKIVKLHQ